MSQEWHYISGRSGFSRCLKSSFAIAFFGNVLIGFHVSVQGQEAAKANPPAYEKYDISDTLRNAAVLKEKQGTKNAMLKGAVAYNKQEVDGYYKGYLLPLLTLPGKPEAGNLARAEITSDVILAEKASDTVMNEFNATLFAEMKKIAEGNYQPSAGIIATQILGMLNKTRAKGAVAAEPLSAATLPLLTLVLNGKNDGIRACALRGLERHIDLQSGTWPDTSRQGLADRLLASLKTDRPANRSLRADAWLRGRTIELLLKVKHAKETELYQYALDVLANPKTDPLLIEKALLITGQYPKSQVAPAIVNSGVSNSLTYLVTRVNGWMNEVGEAQFQGASGGDSAEQPADDGAPMVEDPSGTEEGMGKKAKKKAEPKVNPFAKQSADIVNKRRALHELLENVRYGFTGSRFGPLPHEAKSGLSYLLPEGENQEDMNAVMTALKDLQDAINNPSITDRGTLSSEATPKVKAMLDAIEFLRTTLSNGPQAETTPAATIAP